MSHSQNADSEPEMLIRPATMADSVRLLAWRNDPNTRSMSKSQEPLSQDSHEEWLTERLRRPHPHLYIVTLNHDPVGTFRIDDRQVSYTIAPEWRGRGLATRMLMLVRQIYGPLDAEIKRANTASVAAAKRAGHNVVLLD